MQYDSTRSVALPGVPVDVGPQSGSDLRRIARIRIIGSSGYVDGIFRWRLDPAVLWVSVSMVSSAVDLVSALVPCNLHLNWIGYEVWY